jgi:hypothetical protein
MGAWGAIIMGFFGAVFAALSLDWSGPAKFAPFAVTALIWAIAAVLLRRPGASPTLTKQGERVIQYSSAAEGVGLFLAGNLVTNLGHPEWLLPSMAAVVGLHFLPMAYWLPFKPFGALGVALLFAAGAGFALSDSVGPMVAGLTAAASLWVASLLALQREARGRTVARP